MLRCRPKPGTTLPPPCSHTPSEAPAPAHCEPARRAQMCLRHGQTGCRGSADPLDACGVEYHVGIVDGQVGSALPLAPPSQASAADGGAGRPPCGTSRSPPCGSLPTFVGRSATFSVRRTRMHFVSLCRVHVVPSSLRAVSSSLQ